MSGSKETSHSHENNSHASTHASDEHLNSEKHGFLRTMGHLFRTVSTEVLTGIGGAMILGGSPLLGGLVAVGGGAIGWDGARYSNGTQKLYIIGKVAEAGGAVLNAINPAYRLLNYITKGFSTIATFFSQLKRP